MLKDFNITIRIQKKVYNVTNSGYSKQTTCRDAFKRL